MKLNLLLFSCILIFTCFLSAHAQVFTNDDLSVTKLEDNMWVIETTDKTTMYVVEGTDKAMLIDTGTKCEKLDEVVAKITNKPLYIVITHAHGDHAGNIGYFDEIYLHPADTVLLSKSYEGKVHFVSDSDIFDLGGTQIIVAHMPAHTPGSIVLLDRKSGNCYSGDAFGSGQVWLQLKPSSSMLTYVESCKRMEKQMDAGITKIYCGHYPYVKGPISKAYISEMRQLAEQLDNGTAPEGQDYPVKISIGGNHPMITTLGSASIVYDPEFIK